MFSLSKVHTYVHSYIHTHSQGDFIDHTGIKVERNMQLSNSFMHMLAAKYNGVIGAQ